MLQYKIPQNVGIEDKIVGPFSLRQLLILAVGGGISYVIFAISSRIYELSIIEYIFIALPALFALALALIKIRNVTFAKFILLSLEFAINPKKRMWDHRGISHLVSPDLSDKSAAKKLAAKNEAAGQERKNVNLTSLSATLDSGGFGHVEDIKHEDIDTVDDDDLITQAYFGNKKKSAEDNMYWRTREMQKKKLDLLAKMPQAQPVEPTPAPAPPQAPTPAPAPTPTPAEAATPTPEAEPKTTPKPAVEKAEASAPETPTKPKRKRKRKKKVAQPARPAAETQIHNVEKNKPAKLVPKATKQQEMSLEDLKQGNEIEFNLN